MTPKLLGAVDALDHDTITREHYRRLHGAAATDPPAPPPAAAPVPLAPVGSQGECVFCGEAFTRRSRGQRFDSPRCSGKWAAEQKYGPGGKPSPEQIAEERARTPRSRGACAEVLLVLGKVLDLAGHWHLEVWIDDVTITIAREA